VDPLSDAFFRRIKELKDQHTEHLIGGAIPSHEEYRHVCGVIKGIDMAELELKELLSSVGDDY